MLLKKLFGASLCALTCLASTVLAQGNFTVTGNLVTTHYKAPFVLLGNGSIFTAGSKVMTGAKTSATSYSVSGASEIFDPATGTSTAKANLLQARWGQAMATLNDGQVLVIGGASTSGNVDKIEIYNPVTDAFSLAGYSSPTRIDATAVTLADGRVLVAGGATTTGSLFSNIWVVTVNGQGATVTLVSAAMREASVLTRMNDGRVLISGGMNNSGAALSTLEIFDPATNTVTAVASMTTGRFYHTATLMADGRVFIAGGRSVNDSSSTITSSCNIFDPVTGTITNYGMISAYSLHWAARLDSGKILIAGNEVFDPATSTFAYATSGPNVNRKEAAAIKLPDGRIFIGAGVSNPTGNNILSSTEIFAPTGWSANLAPLAGVGSDQIIYIGSGTQATVNLNGSISTDPENQPLTYAWTGSFGTASGATPSVTLPVGVHVITLTVTDSAAQTASTTTRVAVVQGIDAVTYAQLQTQITTLNGQITTLLAELAAANNTTAALLAEKTVLQSQITALNAQVTTLTTQVADLTAANTALAAQVTSLNTQVGTLTTANTLLTQKNASLTALLQQLLQGFEQIKVLSTSVITISDEKKTSINQALAP
jgi:hypothetical protein